MRLAAVELDEFDDVKDTIVLLLLELSLKEDAELSEEPLELPDDVSDNAVELELLLLADDEFLELLDDDPLEDSELNEAELEDDELDDGETDEDELADVRLSLLLLEALLAEESL